jgi:hypothetical protein
MRCRSALAHSQVLFSLSASKLLGQAAARERVRRVLSRANGLQAVIVDLQRNWFLRQLKFRLPTMVGEMTHREKDH